jgi:hypothetical protein
MRVYLGCLGEELENSHGEVAIVFQYLKRLARDSKPRTRTPAGTVLKRVLRKQAMGILSCDFWCFMWSERRTGDIIRTLNVLERRLEEKIACCTTTHFDPLGGR